MDTIVKLCLEYIKYDPNYAETEDMETEDADEPEEEDEEEEDHDQEEEYSDDDDMSWKVRRSAVKCISVVITTRPELLQAVYDKVRLQRSKFCSAKFLPKPNWLGKKIRRTELAPFVVSTHIF